MGKRARRKKCRMLRVRFTTLVSFLPSLFLPSFSPRYPPSRLPLHCFPFLFLSRPPSASALRPSSIDKGGEGEGPLVAKKLGYFATFHVDKLRLAQSVLGGREAAVAERPGRRGIRAVQGSISSRSLSLSLSSPLTVLNESRRRRRDRSAIRCRFRPRFYECLSDCRLRLARSRRWAMGRSRSVGRSRGRRAVGVCGALLEFQ